MFQVLGRSAGSQHIICVLNGSRRGLGEDSFLLVGGFTEQVVLELGLDFSKARIKTKNSRLSEGHEQRLLYRRWLGQGVSVWFPWRLDEPEGGLG